MSSDAPERAEVERIADLRDGGRLARLAVRLEDVRIRTSRGTGNAFLVGRLADASGAVDFIAFDLPRERMERLGSEMPLVRVSGEAGVHAGRLQCRVSMIEPLEPEPSSEELSRLFAVTTRDVGAMEDDLRQWLAGDPRRPELHAIARTYLDDEAFMARFRVAPAATSLHHAWRGGLLEHTWEVVRMARAVLDGPEAQRLFPGLDRELVLLGAFLHDLGKIDELDWESGVRYTRRGNLVGHVVGGAIDLQRRLEGLRDGDGRPLEVAEELRDTLVHIILSHHGRLEYGSPRLPATPEAIFVAGIDDLAARTAMALDAVGRGPMPGGGGDGGPGGFTDVHPGLGTRLYRGGDRPA
jgi:3'-5' exoribonuclease